MVKRNTVGKKTIGVLIFAAGYLLCALLCVLPFPQATAAVSGEYEAVWQSGAVTRESYAAAYSALCGCGPDKIVLERAGERGEIAAGEAFRKSYAVLQEGNLLELLTAEFGGLSRLERAALYRTFARSVYYSADLYAFDGERVFRTPRGAFNVFVWLDGSVSSSVIRATGAKKLVLHGEAILSASALSGSGIEEIEAREPYVSEGGAVLLRTAGGTRLVAALPACETLSVKDCDFCDEGALSPCTGLVTAELPFAGSAKNASKDDDGRLLWAFGTKIPETLKQVKITGGEISAFAFTGCEKVEEIDLCGIPAERVSSSAFTGCGSLKLLHTAKELSLDGFVRTELACGCFLYERRAS